MFLCVALRKCRGIIEWDVAEMSRLFVLWSMVLGCFTSQDAKCSLCVGLISLAVVAALVLERLVSTDCF